MEIERNNLYAQLEREIVQNEINSDIDILRTELINSLESNRQSLTEVFVACEPVKKVFEEKTKFENLATQLSKLRDSGYEIFFEYKDNIYEYDYKQVLEFQDNLYDIGVVGTGIQSPTSAGFHLWRVQGTTLNWFDTSKLVFHTGIDLYADYGEDIYAQFNGVITKAYYSHTDGNVIELKSGDHLITRYKHVGEILCSVGDTVNQYDKIGVVGSTGSKSNGPHVHIEMYVDNMLINPILLYGQMGKDALIQWMKENPNAFTDVRTVLAQLDVSLQHEIEQVEYHGYYDAREPLSQDIVDKFVAEGRYPKGYQDKVAGPSRGVPEDLRRLADMIKKEGKEDE